MDYSAPLFSIKSSTNGQFYGYASVFDVLDTQNEIIQHGAFSRTLTDYRLQRSLPRMLYEHSDNEIGQWLCIEEDAHGLWVEGQLNIHSPHVGPILESIKIDHPTGLSIGFTATRTRYEQRVRIIHSLKLFEISLVKHPANPLAVIG